MSLIPMTVLYTDILNKRMFTRLMLSHLNELLVSSNKLPKMSVAT